jgi:predicted transcriptional regulator of viral defense system
MSALNNLCRHFGTEEKMNRINKILEITKKYGVIRPRDLDRYNIPRNYITRLYQRGLLQRVGRGLYVNPDNDVSENHTIAQVAKRIPNGIICLISALQYHGLTTQIANEVWIAIERTARYPKEPELPYRIVRFSGAALREGVEKHTIEGIPVKVYNIPKTVADCFKYRNKIGFDVAMEALRECRRYKKCTIDELWYYAKICRVANVMRPYMEVVQ